MEAADRSRSLRRRVAPQLSGPETAAVGEPNWGRSNQPRPRNLPPTDGIPSMATFPHRLRAASVPAALVIAASLPLGFSSNASAQSKSIEVPAYRQLGASEAMDLLCADALLEKPKGRLAAM